METGDRKLNEVAKVTDMAYVPVIMADGSIGQIAKSDLASVVAGQSPFFLLFGASTAEQYSSIDDIDNNSIRYASVSYGNENLPFDYCMILTFVNGYYGMQIAISVDQNKMAYRGKVGGKWNTWAQVQVLV